MSLLSPLRPVLRNGNPLLKFLGNAFTGERIPQRPTPRHLWASEAQGAVNILCIKFNFVRGSWFVSDVYFGRTRILEEISC